MEGAGKLAVVLRINVVELPEALLAEIFAGVSEHDVFDGVPGMTQLKFTSAGKLDPAGVVFKVSKTFDGVPAVSCTPPGTDCEKVKSTLLSENAAGAATPGTEAVTL